ncbi:MAG: S8 family serine peptidase [Kiritimatiellia bacterium]
MMTKRKIVVCSVALAAAGVAFLLCRRAGCPRSGVEPVRSGEAVVCSEPASVAAATPTGQTPTVRGTLPYVLKCKAPFDKPLRLAVEALGARTVGVLDSSVVLVEADAAARSRLLADGRFESLVERQPADKVQSRLAAVLSAGAASVEAAVVALSAEDRGRLVDCIVAGGGELLPGCVNEGATIRARLPSALAVALSRRGDVHWLEKFERPQFLNDRAVNAGAMNVRQVWNLHGLSGAGQVVSTSDSGIDTGDLATLHPDLRDRVAGIKVVDGCSTNDVDGHGTHTAGSIVGDGQMSDGRIRGTAWGATLFAWFCSGGGSVRIPSTMNALFRGDDEGMEWPAHVHSASWGAPLGGAYDTQCADFDRYVWEHPDLLPVVSAGNYGPMPLTVNSPAAAKNVLAVGATENLRSSSQGSQGLSNGTPENTASYSSLGPCQDGRIKPDVAAPGTGVLSTRADGVDYKFGNYDRYYAYCSGTSMACPLTAGAVALVREWLVTNAVELGLSATEPPTAALMKAVITGGADGGLQPNVENGWGRVNLAETLFPADRAVRLIDRIPFAAGSNFVYVVETTNAAPLEVQLVWIDYPGDAEDKTGARKLVNDLDLTVEARMGLGDDRIWRGNGGKLPDQLNNLESVRIETAAPTKYVITVSCPQIVHDWTEGGAAALYVRGAFDPAADPAVDCFARIRERGLGFRDFGQALSEVRDHETLELLDWVWLPSNVVLQTSFVLTATNKVAERTPILRRDDASLTLAEGATVLFTNVTFAAGESAAVRVVQGAKAQVAGTAVFDGLVAGIPGLAVASPSGFELVGRLDNGITIECTGASLPGAQFGRYACATAIAEESAPRLVSAAETTWSGQADGAGRLCWVEAAPVDPAVAVGYVDGETPVYCRTLDQLLDAAPAGARVVVQRSGYPIEQQRTLSGALTIAAAEGAGEIVIRPGGGAGLKLADGCDLTVSGLSFCDYAGNAIFAVDGDGARLTLTNVVFRNIEGTNTHSGAVAVRRGAVRSLDTVFEDCRATGDHYVLTPLGALLKKHVSSSGGAVFLAGDGCALELSGGAIRSCQTRTFGGGVYAKTGAAIAVSGALEVLGNASDNHERDDLYLEPGAELALGGPVTGRDAIGIRYFDSTTSTSDFGNDVSDFCVSLAATVDRQVASDSAAAFFNDAYPDTTEAQLAADVDRLRWVACEPGDRQVDPDDPSAVLAVTKGGVTRYYADAAAAFDWIDDDATVELLANVTFAADLVVTNDASVCLRSRLPDRFVLQRAAADASICVLSGATLVVTNLELNGGSVLASSSLLRVDAGTLELRDGAKVCNAYGAEVRAAGGVSVWNGGSFVLLDGAEIADCVNTSVNEDGSAGYGGGLLVENATADLRGGRITAGRARRGGGVFVGSKSTVYLSGGVTIDANATFDGSSGVLAAKDNLCVADLSELIVTAELTGAIGYNEGISRDTEVFGKATFAGPDEALQASAHRFTHDVSGDVGMAVSDGAETLLVWSLALDDAGGYGENYALLAGEPVPVAPPTAVDGLVYDGQAQTGVVAGVGYTLSDHVAIDAGDYLATASLRAGFVWIDGTDTPVGIAWQIAKGVYDLSGVALVDSQFDYDGTFHYLTLTGTLPEGLLVSYANNGRYQPGTNVVTAIIVPNPNALSPNLELSPNPTTLTARLIVVDAAGLYPGDGEEPSVVTHYPSPIAIQSIDRLPDGKWQIVVTNREPYCWYCLVSTDDLKQGFTVTGEWQQAAADAPKAWTNAIERTEGQYFWRALGKPGEGPATP